MRCQEGRGLGVLCVLFVKEETKLIFILRSISDGKCYGCSRWTSIYCFLRIVEFIFCLELNLIFLRVENWVLWWTQWMCGSNSTFNWWGFERFSKVLHVFSRIEAKPCFIVTKNSSSFEFIFNQNSRFSNGYTSLNITSNIDRNRCYAMF